MKEEKWGINGRVIPQNNIFYDSSKLRDGETIHSDQIDIILKYIRELRGYVIVTDDPSNTFLTTFQCFYIWESWNDVDEKKLGYRKSETELKGAIFTLKDGSKMTVETNDKQYFTPDIEDIRIGYECELWEDGVKFINGKITQVYTGREDDQDCLGLILDDGNGYLIDKSREIKVPYLTKEQIEAEGWISNGKDIPTLKKGVYTIWFSSYKFLGIFEEQCSESIPLYTGECKSINEFRYICKLLKIN